MQGLKELIRDVPDFPIPGVMFRDISPLLRHKFPGVITAMDALFSEEEWAKADIVAGIESRGFILAAAVAGKRGKGFVKIRKPGKLPGPTERVSYGLEYGNDALEMQPGEGNMIIMDDVLATGGTLAAAAALASKTGHKVMGFGVLIDLKYLNKFSWNDLRARAVVEYE